MAKRPTMVIATLFVVLATILNFVAFVSPYWLESDKRATNQFQKIGLWEACLKDFVDPKDYVSKLYNGCWWIFWPEFIEIRYWLNPSWFVALQVISVFNLIILIAGMMTVTGVMCHCCSPDNPSTILKGFGAVFTSFLLSAVEAILFGLGSIDRTWMPQADFNILSWGYWLHVLGGFFAFISSVALFCNWYTRRYEELDDKNSSGGSAGGSNSGSY